MQEELNDLVRVLPEWSMRTVTFYALQAAHAVSAAKITAFVDFIQKRFRAVLAR